MPITTPLIVYGSNALLVKQSVNSVSSSSVQPFCDLLNDIKSVPADSDYVTVEENFWLLDGHQKFMPTTPSIGYISQVQSDGSGVFSVPPTLTIQWSQEYSTSHGLTLHFSDLIGDYPTDIDVAYYDLSNTLIDSHSYSPTSTVFETALGITGFAKVVITFNSTHQAYRFARLLSIEFDVTITFDSSMIKAARLEEKVDLSALTLPFNTLTFTVYSADGSFSILNPDSIAPMLKERQPVDAYEMIDGGSVYLGRFYIDKWNNSFANEVVFECVDAIGVLDKISYYDSVWNQILTGAETNVGQFLQFMFQGLALFPYSIDASLYDLPMYGWLKGKQTYRDILQQTLFGANAYATCARSSAVNVHASFVAKDSMTYDEAEWQITAADKAVVSPVELRPQVTGVEITAHNYVYDGLGDVIVYQATLAAGTYRLTWDSPIFDILVLEGASQGDSGTDYLNITVSTTGQVTVQAKRYIDSTSTYSVYGTFDETTVPNILRVETVPMVHPDNAQAVAQFLYDYFQQRYIQKTKLLGLGIGVPDTASIDTFFAQKIFGVVEKQSTDLIGGFISNVEVIGGIVLP